MSLLAGLPAPEPSLDRDIAPEQISPAPQTYSTQSLGVSLGGSGGAPTAVTGDTDMNGDMGGDYSSSSSGSESDQDADGEEGMSSGEDFNEDSASSCPLTFFLKPLEVMRICLMLHLHDSFEGTLAFL